MNKKTFNVGIIGVGDCAKRFAPQATMHPGLRIVTAADIAPEEEKRPLLENIVKHPVNYFRLTPDMHLPPSFFEGLNAVYISSPNDSHLYQTIESMQQGKLTVTEKPLVRNAGELLALEAVARQGLPGYLFAQDHYAFKPATIYAKEKVPELAKQYGQITGIDVAFLEKGNLTGLPREKWLISPMAGGGVMIDTGVHMATVLNQVAGARFTECNRAEAFDFYPQYNFQCETGTYAEFTAEGQHIAAAQPGKPNVVMRIAKGVDQQQKKITFTFEKGGAKLMIDYDANVARITTSAGETEEKITGPHEYSLVADEMYTILRDGRVPNLTHDSAKRALHPVFMYYQKLGGTSNMRLNKPDAGQIARLVV